MTQSSGKQELVYETPHVLRLGAAGSGAGICSVPGSGVVAICNSGNTAETCDAFGNQAYRDCVSDGNSASGLRCDQFGIGFSA